MTKLKKSVLLLMFCAVASICWGQGMAGGYYYNGGTQVGQGNTVPAMSYTDNIPNCKTTGGNNNCWHLAARGASLDS